MASLTERSRNNVRAGAFVTFTIILALVVIYFLADIGAKLGKEYHTYTVIFPFSAGVENIHAGAGVRVGGMPLGKVKKVEATPQKDSQGAEETFFSQIEVIFNLDSRVPLYPDAVVRVKTSLIGAEAWLEIAERGKPSDEHPEPLPDHDDTLVGSPPATILDAALGDMEEQVKKIIKDVETFTEFLSETPEDYRTKVLPIVDEVRVMISEVHDFHLKQWLEDIDTALAWAGDAPRKFDDLLAEGEGVLADTRAVVAENRGSIDNIIQDTEATMGNAREITSVFKTDTLGRVHEFLDTAHRGLNDAVVIIEKAREDYEDIWSVDIEEILGSAMTSAHEIELMTIDLKDAPWKLLYKATPDELDHELLYNAARSFALAAADLQGASKTAERILDHLEELPEDSPKIKLFMERLKTTLMDPLNHYQNAQEKLFSIILEDTP